MKNQAFNKTNIFKVEIADRKPQNNTMDIDKNINKASLFKIKKTNEKNKNKIISNMKKELFMKKIKKMKKLLFQV
jgi:hypothetical protein